MSRTAEISVSVVNFDRLREIAIQTGATTIVGPPPFELARS